MGRYSRSFGLRETPQASAIPSSTQVPNSAGGFAWPVDDWTRLDRFLVLGSEGGSYYATEQALSVENAHAVLRCLEADAPRAVARIVEISEAGRAPKNTAAVFALALAASHADPDTRRAALTALPRVARIGTHLFQFLDALQRNRGWGRGARRAVGSWYTAKEPEALALQLAKYRQREGWTHRDALRLAHPDPRGLPAYKAALLRWAVKGEMGENLPPLIHAFALAQEATSAKEVVTIIGECSALTWEMIPTEHLAHASVWAALLPNLPMTALIRNLGRMGANGLVAPLSEAANQVCVRLADAHAIRRSRLHPIAVLSALMVYSQGHGARGKLSWEPVAQVVDALDMAFYLAFGNVTPTGKRWLLALDVSGSMAGGEIAGVPGLTPRVGSAAMALVTARVEPQHHICAFSTEMVPVVISPRQRLDDMMRYTDALPFGGTDCAQPMLYALSKGLVVDCFVVYTDSETWAGAIHPAQALLKYRRETGIPAKLVVVGMVSNEFSIADPEDGGMLDVVGFDTATPNLIADFATG